MKQLVTSYGFNKTAKTVTLSGYTTVSPAGLLMIVNANTNTIIYNFADTTQTATFSGNVVTLTYDTTGMNNSDPLQIYYDDGSAADCVQTISNYYVSVSGTLTTLISGASQSGMIVWGTGTSGQTQVQTVSGSYVSVSGAVSVTGSVQVSGAVQVSGTVTANTGLSAAAFSGQIAWGTGTSGQTWVQTTSGSYVSVSGAVSVTGSVQVSGAVQISGTVTANTGLSGASFSGQIVWGTGTSGQVNTQTASGSYVSVSGSVAASVTGGVQVSGAVQVSGTVSIVSGTGVRVSGETVTVTGGVQVSGSVQVSGTVTANTGLSGASFSGMIGWGVGTSGQQWVQTTSGSYVSVSGSVGIASGLYLASGLVVVTSVSGNSVSVASGLYLASGITVVTSVSGNSVGVASGLYLASGLVVATSVSGNTVGISISGASISGAIIWGTGTSGMVNVQTASGSWVTISGSFSANISGNVAWGVGTSGQQWVQTTSGSYVSVSGSVGIASGLYLASGLVVVTSVSGNVMGQSISGGSESGMIVWGYGTSGQFPVYTASGSWVTISGSFSVSANISGNVAWGVGTSGQQWIQTTSGSYVSVSGSVAVTSGTGVRVSGETLYVMISGGNSTTISGGSVSGAVFWGAGTSGQNMVYTASGSYVSVSGSVGIASGLYLASGLVMVTSMSGNVTNPSISGGSISGVWIQQSGEIIWGTGTSGQCLVQTTSGSYVSVSGSVGIASGLYLASGLIVVTSVSGNVLSQTSGAYLASGLVVVTSVSGNVISQSISGGSESGMIVWGIGMSGQSLKALQYQLTIMSGVTLGSGTLVSGGYMSAALTISTLNPLYLRYVAWTGTSGTIASGSALLVRFTPAGGAGTVTLTSTAFTSGVTTPITSYAFASFSGNVLMLLSGDIIQVTTISNNISGITQSVRILCGQ